MKLLATTLGIAAIIAISQAAQDLAKPPAASSSTAQQPAGQSGQNPSAQNPANRPPAPPPVDESAPVTLPPEFSDEKKMALPAEQVFKNVVFFKGRPASDLRDAMLRIKPETAHGCMHCHDTSNFADTTKQERQHHIGMQMLQITKLANDTLYPENPTKVTCWTCHRTKDEPERLPRTQTPPELDAYNQFVPLTPEQAEKPAGEVFKNLKVIPKDLPAKSLAQIMVLFSRSLAVKCSHCHDVHAFESDSLEEKNTARRMYAMVLDSKAKFYANERNTRMSCWACHHQRVEPEETPKEFRQLPKDFKTGL